ncbi:MAG: D-alanyl-D-alanine carboxypeptidase/D-alanyl-D-alanine-endopeptidase [Actinomycetota bacterium]
MRARALLAILLVSSVVVAIPITSQAATGVRGAPVVRLHGVSPSADEPGWQRRINALVGDRPMSVTIGDDGAFWYRHLAWVARAPASNEKLLLSMALLSTFGPGHVMQTRAMAAAAPVDGVIDGDLWLVGHGDPELGPQGLNALAREIEAAGVTRIEGSVLGDTGPFERDWWAPGWKDDFPAEEVAIPTALTFRGNLGPEGRHIDDPELRAAAYLTKALRRRGIHIEGPAGVGSPDGARVKIAAIDSAPIVDILHRMDVDSVNFDAEVLGKVLGAEVSGTASIAAGAAAIDAFTAANGAPRFEHRDASGLSYANRVTAQGMLRLLWTADRQPWASDLRLAMPIGGQGTLEGRLGHTRIRAKTGTLTEISALSGWVWSRKVKDWVEFSILSNGMSKDEAMRIEDAIIRLVSTRAKAPVS